MLQHASQKFDSIDTIEVGFAWDSNLKVFVVPFSIMSIVEEFTDFALVIEDGELVKKIPMDSVEERSFHGIGKQKCFLARHSEVYTFFENYKHLGVKHIRFYAGFPDHSFETINTIISLGIGDPHASPYRDHSIVPVEYLTSILRKFSPPPGYIEKENLWVKIIGEKDGQEKKILMECLVPTLSGWEESGCNVDTGIPASLVAQMIYHHEITAVGSFAPESVVPADLLFARLARYGMTVYENGIKISGPAGPEAENMKRPSQFVVAKSITE